MQTSKMNSSRVIIVQKPNHHEHQKMKNNNVRRKDEPESNMRQLVKEMLAELLGTYMLMLIGSSSTASLVLNIHNVQNKFIDIPGICYCWGFGAFVGICASMAISAFATLRRFPWSKVGPYILAQILGAFLGSATAYLVYYDAINMQHELAPLINQTEFRAYGHALSTGSIFATYPADHSTIVGCFIDQVVATCSLLISVMVVVDKNNLNVPMFLQPFLLAFIIATHAQAFGFNSGCSMNPARDFGPRLFTSVAGWGIQVFRPLDGHYWWSAGIAGPIFGAIIGVWLYYYVIEFFNINPKPKAVDDNYGNEMKPV